MSTQLHFLQVPVYSQDRGCPSAWGGQISPWQVPPRALQCPRQEWWEMMSRHGPNTFPLNISQPHKRSPLPISGAWVSFLRNRVSPCPLRDVVVWEVQEREQCSPVGSGKVTYVSSHCQTASKETQPREGWGGSRLFTVSWEWLPCTSRVCKVRTEDSPFPSESKPWKSFAITMQMKGHSPQTSQGTSVNSLIHSFCHLSYSSFLITLPQ